MTVLVPPPPRGVLPQTRTIIAGSRGITDPAHVRRAMESCPWLPSRVVSGGARGVDTLGEQWAKERGIPVARHRPDWEGVGKSAGLRRNETMADEADGLVAVWDGRSAGTRHMIDTARARGLRVHVVEVLAQFPVAVPPPPRAVVPPPPKPIHQLARGTVLRVGMGAATVSAEIDMETFSEAGWTWNAAVRKWEKPFGASKQKKGLEIVGMDNYARHPSAAILMFAYDLKDGIGWRLWLEGMPFPDDLAAHIAAGGLLEAHNSGFEERMWHHVGEKKYGWPAMPAAQWRCSAAKSRAHAYPGKLEKVGAVMELDIQKDAAGKTLIDRFTMPRNPTSSDPRTRILLLWSADVDAARRAYLKANIPTGYHVAEVYVESGKPPTSKKGVEVTNLRGKWYRVVTLGALTPEAVARDHADSLAFARYCVRDIQSEAEVSGRCPDLEGEELAWWQFGQTANARGVHLNRQGLENCAEVVLQCLARYDQELQQLTGIEAASKVKQITAWLAGQGVHTDSLDEEHLDELLARTDLPPLARRVLEIRAAAGSASVKKVFAMLNTISPDDRLRDIYIVNGARTGRDIGVGAQPANLPSAGPAPYVCAVCATQFAGGLACPACRAPLPPTAKPGEWNVVAVQQALATIAARSLAEVERVWGAGNALHVVAGCLRALFDAAPGHDLISSDYNSIEAVAMAMVSGEKWRIDTFNTHGKIYEASAAAMFKIPFEDFMLHRGYTREQLAQPEWWTLEPANKGTHHKLRKTGKVAELAFGFQGWLGSAQAFGMPGTDDEIKENILKWRAASPCIEWLWGGQTVGKADTARHHAGMPTRAPLRMDRRTGKLEADGWNSAPELFGVEGMFLRAIEQEGVEFKITRLDGSDTGFSYTRLGDVIWAKLPSGRYLKYHRPRATPGRRDGEMSMSYEGWNTNPKNGPIGWIRMDTWGGRLVENLIQAICRDILRAAVLRLESAGFPVVMRTYDEVVCEILKHFGSHSEFEAIVEKRPPFALNWPIRAPDSWRGAFYRKA